MRSLSFGSVVNVFAGLALGGVVLGACGSDPAETLGRAGAALSAPATHPLRADGLLPGMARFRGGKQQTSNPVCASPKLSYFGGPLIQSPVVVAVFWTGTVNATLQANIGQFYTDVTQSSYWSLLHEYDSVGLSPGSNQAILPGTFAGNFVITPLVCAPGGFNCKVSDAQVQAELTRQIGLGVLPAPKLDCTGNVETVYMVHFPPNIRLSGPFGAGTSCANMGFCGYHNTGTYGASNTPLVYGIIMDVFTGPCAAGCGGNATPLDDATDLASHELAEAVTDADIGLDMQPNYAAPAAWGDNNNMCGEVGDICDDGSPGDTIVVGGHKWVVQQLWSNQQGKCTSSGPAQAVCSGTNVTGCRKCSCGDDGGACSGTTGVCETSSSNVLFGGCEVCTATNNPCSGGTCQQSSTPSQDDICTGCMPKTTCPAGDDCGTVPDGCGGVVSCGACAAPKTCGGGTPSNPNQCGCTPLTQCPAGQSCGSASDGCGGMLACGTCTAPLTCGGGGKPGVCGAGCLPKTCAAEGFNCGMQSDGCTGMIDCGSCAAPETCGGGGKPGVCGIGCTPVTCQALGFNCGLQSDGCGGILNCGTCLPPQACGGGGNPGVCGIGCTPTTCAQQNVQCGVIGNGCGSALDCGNCPPPTVCGATTFGQCGCLPKSCAQQGLDCGSATDGCGAMLDCGTCVAPQTCGGTGIPNTCGCIPAAVCPVGVTCGDLPDGCGGILPCGTCAANEVCVGNTCVSELPDAGTSTSSSSGGTTGSSSSTSGTTGTTTSAASSSSSSGAGGANPALIKIWGRAGCAVGAASPREDDDGAGLGLVALAGLAGLARRRRALRAPSRFWGAR